MKQENQQPSHRDWDIHVKSQSGSITIERTHASNPDDAIYAAYLRGHYFPDHGDRVVRCVEVSG